MDGWGWASASALGLGLVTSISPCPLASNIAAISYVGRGAGNTSRVLVSGTLYTLGRVVAYAALAAGIVAGLSSVPRLSFFLQRHINQMVGPVLLVAGVVLLEWIAVPWFRGGDGLAAQRWTEKAGLAGAFLLGAFLALAFCPVSAALFFGSLIPLCIERQSAFVLPSLYGFGTGLPVVVFAALLTLGVHSVGKAYQHTLSLEKWARRVTAVVFFGIGLHYSLAFTLPALGLRTGWGE